MRQNTINCTHHLSNLQIVFTFLTWRTFSMCQSVMWRISSSNNMSCGEISPHGRSFLHRHRPWCPWQISSMGGGTHERLYGFHSLPLRVLNSLERVHCTDSRLTAGELVKLIIGKTQGSSRWTRKTVQNYKTYRNRLFLVWTFFCYFFLLSTLKLSWCWHFHPKICKLSIPAPDQMKYYKI